MVSLESFPERLKNYRKMMGWRQEELAKQWNYALDTISAWERGVRNPNSQQIPRLAQLLKISPEELVQSINLTHSKVRIHTSSATISNEEEQERRSTFGVQGEIQHIYINRSKFNLEFSYPRMFEKARDILAVGISLNAIAMNYGREEIIHSIIDKKSTYCLCFLDPDSPKCAEREREEQVHEGFIAALTRLNISNMQNICDSIHKRDSDCAQQLKLMTYDLSPRFNIYIFDDELMTVQFYAYDRGEDTPTFVLRRQAKKGLFDFYSSVAHHIIEQSKPTNI